MRLLFSFIILANSALTYGQTLTPEIDSANKTFTNYSGKWLHTESRYADSAGGTLTIQNSLPRGGGQYTDPEGKTYSYVIFWNRIINETHFDLRFSIQFPGDPVSMFPSGDSHIRLFLHPGFMTLDKETLRDFGITDLKSILDNYYGNQTSTRQIVKQQTESLFQVIVIFHNATGSARSSLYLKGNELSYKISVGPTLSPEIPCGRVYFTN